MNAWDPGGPINCVPGDHADRIITHVIQHDPPHLREVLEDGHDVLRWELHAPRDGLRFVLVYVKNGPPPTWDQPWEGECI